MDTFNAKMLEFVSDLANAFPTMPDFVTLKSALLFAINFSPDQPTILFQKFVVEPYFSQIQDRDERFFLENHFTAGPSDIIERVRSVWHLMSKNDRTNVWNYLNILAFLSNKITEKMRRSR